MCIEVIYIDGEVVRVGMFEFFDFKVGIQVMIIIEEVVIGDVVGSELNDQVIVVVCGRGGIGRGIGRQGDVIVGCIVFEYDDVKFGLFEVDRFQCYWFVGLDDGYKVEGKGSVGFFSQWYFFKSVFFDYRK